MRKLFIGTLVCLFTFGAAAVYGDDAPEVAAHGAILMEALSGRVLWEKNAHEPMAMASTTKIMTAVLALEQGNMDDVVTVSGLAAAAPRVKMYLQAGEEISLGNLLYALMLQSSNDAAVAIAEHISGNVEAFCAAMTQKAHEIGAANTIFKTPNGLDAENHQSTAYDMAVMTRYALSNTMFLEIINTTSRQAVSSRTTYNISNKNRLLYEYEGANGVKTGYTGKAGHCFVGAAKREDMQLISVVFASGWGQRGREQKWADTKVILNYGFNEFDNRMIIEGGAAAGEMAVARSRMDGMAVHYGDGIILPVRNGDEITVVPQYPAEMKAPIAQNQPVGEGHVYISGEYFTAVPILAGDTAVRHDLKTSMEKVLREFLRLGSNAPVELVLPEF